jgi:3-oxoacyl-[acyl-carrier protein] reductase
MSKLANKVAVVTGASKGIGASIAQHLAAEGASVVVNYSTSKDGAEKVVKAIVSAGGKAVAVGANLTHEAEVRALFDATKQQYGRVDILVNNAGLYTFAPLEDITSEHYHRLYDTNVLALLLVTKAALDLFPVSGGSVINIGSAVSALTPPMAAVYSSSKAAVDAITRTLAKELAPRNIRVNSINPGMILTEGLQSAGIPDSPLEAQLLTMTPLGRMGQPEEIALPAVFLASDDARYMTGAIISVSGGAGI